MKVYRITATRNRDSRHFQTDLIGYNAKLLSRQGFERMADSSRYSDVKLLCGSKRPGKAARAFAVLDSAC